MINPVENPHSEQQPINLLGLDLQGMTQFFLNLGEKKFRAHQVFKWIHKYLQNDFEQMTDISKTLRSQLKVISEVKAPDIAKEQKSEDGTIKWLLRLHDDNYIETVFIPESDRGTLCISSQVGCALNCSFCSTAKQGFNRNLSTDEIVGQVWLAAKQLAPHHLAITNIVLMGMGEPLLNFDAVIPALNILRDELGYALPRRRVTLSTAGVVPKIDCLKEAADVSLAISLHAPNNELRNELVPLNKKYPIEVLMEACKRYVNDDKRRHITMEYVMLKDVNDSLMHAKQLIKVLQGVSCKVNLIPFNPHPGALYQRSKEDAIQQFRFALIRAGFVTTVRKTRGEDIDAACGQLAGKILDRTKRSERWQALRLRLKEESEWIEKTA